MAITRIHCKGPYTYEEATTLGVVTPGMLVELNGNGLLIPHAEEGGRGEAGFAQEDALQGKAVGDSYTTGTLAGYILPRKGCEVHALLATGQSVNIGDELVSDGAGALQARGSAGSGVSEWQTIGRAMEAEDNSSGTAAVLIKVRVV
jgi:hypothetical protein